MLTIQRQPRTPGLTSSERNRNARERNGEQGRTDNATRMRDARATAIPEFIGVDGEGVGRGKNHRYVLLSVGTGHYEQYPRITWEGAFEYLYSTFQQKPNAAYIGFYLGYDWGQIFKTLPQEKAFLLLHKKGRALRVHHATRKGYSRTYPVRCEGWEFDMMGNTRMQLRPSNCDCHLSPAALKECHHKGLPWMYLCDTGHFWQMSLLKVLDPKGWKDDPQGPICTEDEYAIVEKGKRQRATAQLDDEMRMYNSLENVLLARAMHRLAEGMVTTGIHLPPSRWYGPGAAAEQWLANVGAPKRTELSPDNVMGPFPTYARRACKNSYYGGWFEIFSHGIIPGKSWNYDINSAYPYAISNLPCMRHGRWARGTGKYRGQSPYVCYDMRVQGCNDRIGCVPNRRKDGSIYRPSVSRGWYWMDEILAGQRAGIISNMGQRYYEWVAFEPRCDHKPFSGVADLYQSRLDGGKSSAEGIAKKLIMNSGYGKFAQSVGNPQYANWFYSSRITASCRIQILDAIASHPNKADSVLMVATDGICFDTPNPNLECSSRLGEWEETEYTDLCLFKPGVYWSANGKRAAVKLKARGVPSKEFIKHLDECEDGFREMARAITEGDDWDWPTVEMPIEFSFITPKQALMRGKWDLAGMLVHGEKVTQSSNPVSKRGRWVEWSPYQGRFNTRVIQITWDEANSVPYGEEILPTTGCPQVFRDTQDGPVKSMLGQLIDASKGGVIQWVTAGHAANSGN